MTDTTSLPCAVYWLFLAPVAALSAGFFLFHRRRPSLTHWPVLASCAVICASSLHLAWLVLQGGSWDQTVYRWALAGSFSIDFGIRIDALSSSVLAMVAVVGSLIHVYAVGYMREDPSFSRFFLYFHFFFLSMVGLLVSNNYLQMYFFWEGVGLASFLLIGFWYEKQSARSAAWKAFLTNRVGDVGFLLAVLLLLRWTGTVRFEEVFAGAASMPLERVTAIGLLLFWGASAKSAQFPLHVWLPDAMEGPTPVSALMHAATMVTAGVFLMARSTPLIEHSPAVLAVVALVGVLTALGAAAVAFTRKDLKRILAYSTVSQLGFMMLAIGTGNTFGAVFHLITHGFFKALLFLCAGSVIHGLHDSLQGASSAGVDDAGGLSGKLPVTFTCFVVGALALAGFPPLSGFFSKDLILEGVLETESYALNALVSLIAAGSSLYIFRMLFLTFLGERGAQRGPRAHAHEPGLWMRVPLLLLAVLSAAAGALGPSGVLARMFGVETPHLSLGVSLWGTAFGALGLLAAWLWTMHDADLDWDWRRKHPEAEAAFDTEFGWQPFMSGAARLGGSFADLLARAWERERWDRFTEGLADSCVGLGEGLSAVSRGRLNEYAWWMAAAAAAFLLAAVL